MRSSLYSSADTRGPRVRFLVALAAFLPSLCVQAQGGPHGNPQGNYAPRMMMMDPGDLCPMEGGPSLHGYPWRMRLTDTQREQAEKIMDRSRTRLSALREQKQAAQARLREALSASNRNQPEIMQAYREAATLREREFEIQLETQREFDQLLGR